MKRNLWLAILLALGASLCGAGKAPTPTWTDPEAAAREDPDFTIQGEYGVDAPGEPWGVQVVALGKGNFEAYVLEGGLPGLGWNRERMRIRLEGGREGDAVVFAPSEEGYAARIEAGVVAVSRGEEEIARLARVERVSPTMGAKAPEGAIVLFDGTSAEAWENGRVENGLLPNNDVVTKRKFGSYHLHLEFRTPYKPFARGQARGNSGVYHQRRYETQVLDSFGLTGESNEAGGVYKTAAPLINMCFPPLRWQTYDIDFTTASFDEAGQRTAPARMTVRLNGVVVQDDLELPATTGGAKLEITPEPGPIYLQSHGNPVFYRNIWLVEK